MNGFTAVLATIIQGGCALLVGWLYDHAGRNAAWALVLGLLTAAAALTLLLIRRDRIQYPKLYESDEETQDA